MKAKKWKIQSLKRLENQNKPTGWGFTTEKSSVFERNMVNYGRYIAAYETVTILKPATIKY